MTSAFTGGVTLKRGNGAGTEVFVAVPEMILAPILGQAFGEIEVSNYDSTAKEYIAELLGEGNEVDVEFNLILGDVNQALVLADVQGGVTSNYEMIVTDGTNILTSTFALTPKSWSREPSFTNQHKFSFGFKISGAIVDVAS